MMTFKPALCSAALPFIAATALAQTEAPLSPEQVALGSRVFVGEAECDQQQRVHVRAVEGQPGYFEVRHLKARYLLAPEQTQTGAVRLANAQTGMVWLQIPAKSMLLDTAKGSRLVDGCTLVEQRPLVLDARDSWARGLAGDFGIAAMGR